MTGVQTCALPIYSKYGNVLFQGGHVTGFTGQKEQATKDGFITDGAYWHSKTNVGATQTFGYAKDKRVGSGS